ncbi:MAG: hypothetical protein GDA51_02470 [Ekhidna sp.]|nr:hypothetical protein [Ekhidna sp.]
MAVQDGREGLASGLREDDSYHSERMIKLGKQLENPYSVANMQRAWDNIAGAGARTSDAPEVKTTHYYVKFTPQTEEELEILKDDTTLILFDYPLDYEIEAGIGDAYRDPSVPIGQPTPQYCAVEADYRFPSRVGYEILEDLFIPDDYSDDAQSQSARLAPADEELINRLVYEAMKLTGNLEETEENENPTLGLFGSGGSSWRPTGRIMVWDDTGADLTSTRRVFSHYDYSGCSGYNSSLPEFLKERVYGNCRIAAYRTTTTTTRTNWVPLEGVEVRARRWFTVKEGFTNAQGYYSCNGTFKNPANYSIKWERYHFSIRSGTFGQALYNGPKKTGNWNMNFGRRGADKVNDMQQYYALIFQAARDYYYGSRFGLSSPPRNSFWKPQVKISASQTSRQHKKDSHAAPYARTGGILPSVYIRKWNDAADRVYGVTAHELAHLAHWDMDRDAFRKLLLKRYPLGNKSPEAVIESWASGVEWQFAQQRYKNLYGNAGYKYESDISINSLSNGNYQAQTISGKPIYTSIVVDMIDDENQRITKGGTQYPMDRVSGYTIQQIEAGLRGATSWNGWRDNMRSRHSNSTKNFLNELFGNWH